MPIIRVEMLKGRTVGKKLTPKNLQYSNGQ